MSSITGSMTAASSAACSWVNTAANGVKSGLLTLAAKVSNLFQALTKYASFALGNAQNTLSSLVNVAKANPQIALGGLAAAVLVAGAVYAYKSA